MEELKAEIIEVLRSYITGFASIHDCLSEIMQVIEKRYGDDLK